MADVNTDRPFFSSVYTPYQCAEARYNGLRFAKFPERAG